MNRNALKHRLPPMRKPSHVLWIAVGLLCIMAAMMLGLAVQDSATVDETSHLATGYSYWKGYRYKLIADHPPLGQRLPAVPLLFQNVRISAAAQAILDGRLDYSWMTPWNGPLKSVKDAVPVGCEGRYVTLPPLGDLMVEWNCTKEYPSDNWYYVAASSQMLGKVLVYGGDNDGDRLLFLGRLMQVGLTLACGVLIFLFTRKATVVVTAPVVALVIWVFNPIVLAYGHLTNTDIGVTLGIVLSLFFLARFIEKPVPKWASLCGIATGMALCMKYSAVLLLPMGVVVLAFHIGSLRRRCVNPVTSFAIFAFAVWAVLLLVYFPNWSPAPELTVQTAETFGVPGWFQALRPILIPRDFFKGLALVMSRSAVGHESYFRGEWAQQGWWYYFPVILILKSPMAFIVMLGWSLIKCGCQFRLMGVYERTCWLASATYLAWAMTSSINIGIRHLLPLFPLLCIGIGCAYGRIANRFGKRIFLGCCVWLILVTVSAYPLYIQFFNEIVGGAKNGYIYSWDSNYDWGQDAKRLKRYLDQHGIRHIYLDYFGNQYSIEYLGITNTRITAEKARSLTNGYLVVSTSRLLAPEWAWLRESRQPFARVAHTLFVYQFP